MAGLYVHVPFCRQRCTYCDFYFVTTGKAADGTPRKSPAGFTRAVLAEIAHYAETHGARGPFDTIYVGGGTPSLLPLDDVFAVLDALRTGFRVDAPKEVTFEVNPDDATPEYLRGLRAMGVDRLSLGVQSFFDADLRWMNRAHDARQAEASVEAIRAAGFANFSVDLIFGGPDQPEEYWAANLQKAADLGVPHLSTYMLTVEEGTPLGKNVARGLARPAPDDEVADRFRFTMDYLRGRGYEHYEISSFALPGARAVHNHRYWDHADYLGFGPSAHSFWWDRRLGGRGAERWSNLRSLARYEALLGARTLPVDERQKLSLDALANEHVMLRLRTADGLDLDRLTERYGADLVDEKVDDLAALETEGLVTLRAGRLRLTDAGKLLADAVTERLLFDETHRGV